MIKMFSSQHGKARCRGLLLCLLGALSLNAGAATRAYVPDEKGASVSVVDVGAGSVVANIPVGPAPIGVAVAPNGRFAYVTQHNSGAVAVISTNTNDILAQIAVGSNPIGVAVSPDGARLYVSNSPTATSSGAGSLWVSGSLAIVDTLARALIGTTTVGANPAGVAVSPNGARVYVANAGSDTLSVVSTASNLVTATVPVGLNPFGVAASTDGLRIYVVNGGDATVSVIDAVSLTVVSAIRVGGYPTGVAVSDDSARVVVSNLFDNSVSVIDAATLSVTSTTTAGVGQAPAGVAFAPGTSTALVANSRSATLSSVNAVDGVATLATASTLGAPVSLGKFIASTPQCALDVSSDGLVSVASDGILLLRYLVGFRGASLVQGISGIGQGVSTAQLEQLIASLNLDADGDSLSSAPTDGVLLVRALFGLESSSLIANASNAAHPSVRSATQILEWVAQTHGATCLPE